MLLALEALECYPYTWRAERALSKAIFSDPLPYFTLVGHKGAVGSATWSPSGTRILTASSDGTARVWDAQTGEELAALVEHEGSVTYTAWLPDGARIVTTSTDGTVKVWFAWQSWEEAAEYLRQYCLVRELTAEERTSYGLPPRD